MYTTSKRFAAHSISHVIDVLTDYTQWEVFNLDFNGSSSKYLEERSTTCQDGNRKRYYCLSETEINNKLYFQLLFY